MSHFELINNTFYAVNEKSKKATNDYKPFVTLTTKKTGERILISLKDNSNGIPDAM